MNNEFCVSTWKQSTITDSIKYQHLKTFVETYERAHLKKNKNAVQTTIEKVWRKMKEDFTAGNEIEKEVRRQANDSVT